MNTGWPLTLVINLDKRCKSDDGIGEDQRRGTDIVDPRSGIVVRHYVPVTQSLRQKSVIGLSFSETSHVPMYVMISLTVSICGTFKYLCAYVLADTAALTFVSSFHWGRERLLR